MSATLEETTRGSRDDVRSWLGQSVVLVASRYTILGVGFFASSAAARALGPALRGSYAPAVALSALMVQLGNLGLQGPNIFYAAEDNNRAPRLFANSAAASAIIGGLVAVLGFTFGPVSELAADVRLIAAVGVPVLILYGLTQALLSGVSRFTELALVDVGVTGLAALIIGAFIWTRELTPARVILASVIANTLGVIVILRVVPAWRRGLLDLGLLRKSLTMGLRPWVSGIAAGIMTRTDVLFLTRYADAATVGQYSVAVTLITAINTAGAAAAMVLLPQLIAQRVRSRRLQQTTTAVRLTAIILGAGLFIVSLGAARIMALLFGSAYLPAATFLSLMLPGAFALTVETVLVQMINADGYPASVVVVWCIVAVASIGIYSVAASRWGASGVAAAWSLCQLLLLAGIVAVGRTRERRHSAGAATPIGAI